MLTPLLPGCGGREGPKRPCKTALFVSAVPNETRPRRRTGGALRRFARHPRVAGAERAYCSSLRTDCGSWLACATIAVPACCRIWARDMFAVSDAKSASVIRLAAADWFSTELCRFDTTALKRFCEAPKVARWLLTSLIAASMLSITVF